MAAEGIGSEVDLRTVRCALPRMEAKAGEVSRLKQYIYKASDLGLSQWPDGILRLDGIDVTENPQEADVFTVPGNIRMFEVQGQQGVLNHEELNRLPYFKGNESRHAFFDVSDNFTEPIRLPILFIRCDVRTWMLPHDPNT